MVVAERTNEKSFAVTLTVFAWREDGWDAAAPGPNNAGTTTDAAAIERSFPVASLGRCPSRASMRMRARGIGHSTDPGGGVLSSIRSSGRTGRFLSRQRQRRAIGGEPP